MRRLPRCGPRARCVRPPRPSFIPLCDAARRSGWHLRILRVCPAAARRRAQRRGRDRRAARRRASRDRSGGCGDAFGARAFKRGGLSAQRLSRRQTAAGVARHAERLAPRGHGAVEFTRPTTGVGQRPSPIGSVRCDAPATRDFPTARAAAAGGRDSAARRRTRLVSRQRHRIRRASRIGPRRSGGSDRAGVVRSVARR